MAEVAREHGWHPPKSLDSDENFKPKHKLFFYLRTFWRSLGKKVPFWVKNSVSWSRSALLHGYICMPGAANTAGHALNHAYGRKLNGAEEECRRQGIAFLPIVAETFEGWHPEAGRQVKKLGTALARHTG